MFIIIISCYLKDGKQAKFMTQAFIVVQFLLALIMWKVKSQLNTYLDIFHIEGGYVNDAFSILPLY